LRPAITTARLGAGCLADSIAGREFGRSLAVSVTRRESHRRRRTGTPRCRRASRSGASRSGASR